MLKITPINDKEAQKELSAACGLDFAPERMAYQIYEGEKFLGIAEFYISGKVGYISRIRNSVGSFDTDALEIAGRAVLNFLDLCGIKDVVCEVHEPLDEILAKRMTFEKDSDGRYKINLVGFFNEPCKRCKKAD